MMLDAANFAKALNGKPAAVFGLGRSNLAVIRALVAAGAQVAAWDDNPANITEAQKLGARAVNLASADMEPFACLILAPGVPFSFPAPHPVVANAQRAGLEIICDIEVFHRCRLGRRIIGITGTNGKSTTTALLGHVLNENGIPAQVGGNIGRAVFDLDLPPENGVFVLEISSYQLDLCPTFVPDIAVLLNITPDHLDRHGGMDGYVRAKARLLRGHGSGVVCIDDAETRAIYDDIRAAGYRRLTPVSLTARLADGVSVENGQLADGAGFSADLANLPTLRGLHNQQNAAAAYAAARLAGLAPENIVAAFATFPGLAHRQFRVAEIGGIAYIDDSKATNAAAAAKALASYPAIYWIAGGRAKEGGLSDIPDDVLPNIRHAYLVGEAAADFAVWLAARDVPHTICGTLDNAVEAAHRRAQQERPEGATVLLSPACASFDQFRNFEERGKYFAALVETLRLE